MILPGSYANGFAPRDGQPLYPELWPRHRCEVAANPSLGPTGSILRDWSGKARHISLLNGTSFSGGGLQFDGTDDYSTGTSTAIGTGDYTLMFRVKKAASGSTLRLLNESANVTVASGPLNFPLVTYRPTHIGAQGDTRGDYQFTGGGFLDDANPHTIVVRRTAGSVDCFFDGVATMNRTATGTNSDQSGVNFNATAFAMGRFLYLATPFYTAASTLLDFAIFTSSLPVSIIRTIMSVPSAAYMLAPRHKASTAVQFNRRRRLLIGASS